MPIRDPAAYMWVARETAYETAGCLTVVTGYPVESALRTVGADPSRVAATSIGFSGEGVPAIAAVPVPAEDAAVVLIEENGYEGARPEVLKALSRKGAAASAFWNVNGVVRFGCARRGRVGYTAELPDLESDGVPRALRRHVAAADAGDADLIAIAVAMVATYADIDLPNVADIVQPKRFHPISAPILGLPVTAEELIGLQIPTPELVAAARAATPEACRRLAEWVAVDAVDATGLRDHPAVTEVVAQFADRAGPVTLGSAFIDLRNHVARQLDIADDAAGVARNSLTTEAERARLDQESSKWALSLWALRALVYLAVRDPVTAALGSTYCASIRHRRGEAATRFHQQALEKLA